MPKLPTKTKTKPGLLAIDPATVSGWATRDKWGTWDLRRKRDESVGIMLLRFSSFLDEIVKLANISIIAFERPGGRFHNDVISHAKFVGEIEKYCAEHNIEYIGKSSKEIKKFATGNGNCGKPAMIEAAKVKLKYTGTSDNEADAMWLYAMVKQELNL